MPKILIPMIALLIGAPAQAQDLNAINNAFNAQLNARMAGTQNDIVRSNVNSPRVQAMYRQYRAQGGNMSLSQFAYKYAATGGFTPQGYSNYNSTTTQIGAQQRRAMQGYWAAQQNSRNAYAGWTRGYAANQQEAGRVMNGQMSYYNPANGQTVQLGYIPPGAAAAQGGYTYQMAPDGRYYASTGNGYWVPVSPAGRAPR